MLDARSVVAGHLADLHFTLQHEQPRDLDDVEIVTLDPFLRGLLFTDGTVTRALEAHTLSPVTVEPVDQRTVPAPEPAARYLGMQESEQCLRRRVTMSIADEHLAVWAESYLVPERLPADFFGLLGATSQGIGGSLQQIHLESWRELLTFGLSAPPEWASGATLTPPARMLTRRYRIITQGLAAMLISETFALEMHSGLYRLVGSAGSAPDGSDGVNGAASPTGTR
ncbi:MAG: chorismate pyruvate-lyase family protein [Solirubrobacteraceae bacterium]|jgi:chorismate-pyruvate lyase